MLHPTSMKNLHGIPRQSSSNYLSQTPMMTRLQPSPPNLDYYRRLLPFQHPTGFMYLHEDLLYPNRISIVQMPSGTHQMQIEYHLLSQETSLPTTLLTGRDLHAFPNQLPHPRWTCLQSTISQPWTYPPSCTNRLQEEQYHGSTIRSFTIREERQRTRRTDGHVIV